MAHAQKPEFVFPRNGLVHLNRWGRQFRRLLAVEECASVIVMIVMLYRPLSEVKWNCTGNPLHSPVSPSLPLPCVTVCHQVPNELYLFFNTSTTALGPTQWVPMGAVSPRGKAAMGAANHSPPPSAEVKNKWIYTSTSQWSYTCTHTCDYMRCTETTLPLHYNQTNYSAPHSPT